MRCLILSLVTLLTASALSAQAANVGYYGRGCDLPGNPPPLLRVTGLPQLGAQITVRYAGPNGQTPVSDDHPVLITGFRTLAWTIPAISSLQPGNCQLLVTPDIMLPMASTGTRYQDQVSLTIPSDTSLIGAMFHQQFADLYSRCQPTCNLLMVRVSNAATLTIGT